MSFSKIIIHGRLTKTPELRNTQSGKEVCSFTVACDRDFVKQGEERQSDFYECVIFGGGANVLSKHFDKGSEIIVAGRMEMRRWTDKDGQNRISWQVMVSDFDFCGSKRDRSAPNVEAPSAQAPPMQATQPVSEQTWEYEDGEGLPFI